MPSFELRPAAKADFAFCWPIYRDTLRPLMEAVADWREADQQRVVERAMADPGSSILRSDKAAQSTTHFGPAARMALLNRASDPYA